MKDGNGIGDDDDGDDDDADLRSYDDGDNDNEETMMIMSICSNANMISKPLQMSVLPELLLSFTPLAEMHAVLLRSISSLLCVSSPFRSKHTRQSWSTLVLFWTIFSRNGSSSNGR